MFKKILPVVLLLLGFSITLFAYAYWDVLVKTEDETLMIGQGVTLVVEDTSEALGDKKLVPSGVIMKPNDVTSVVFTYNVNFDFATIKPLLLTVEDSDVKIDGVDTYANLVNIVIEWQDVEVWKVLDTTTLFDAESADQTILIRVTITLDAPDNQTEYDAVYGQAITFTLTFEVEEPVS